MSIDRRRCRILAMQALCQWDVQQDDSVDALTMMMQSQEASDADIRGALEMVAAIRRRADQVDQFIMDASQHWELARMSPVERNVMRVAIGEWLATNVPRRVVLNEAIEIVREFGDKNSSGYVNGVLDAVLNQLDKPGKESQ
jgi:N utilization substance protein B